jgi:NAD(P)H-dependent FMN reductase
MAFFIPVILGSTRRDRQSIKVAKFAFKRLQEDRSIETELIDLKDLNFPIMEERLRFREDPPPGVREFSQKIARADSIVVVSPEYNHGYPGVLKNALDYLLPEYERKPFGFVTVSAGGFGGLNCLTQLQLISLGMGAFPIPASFSVSRVQYSFDDEGNPIDPHDEKRFVDFRAELLWFTEAIATQKKKDFSKDKIA